MVRLALVLLLAGKPAGPPALAGLRVDSGPTRFAGDGRLLATVSPNGDGVRDRAVVRFRLDRAATVRLDALRTDTVRSGRILTVWSTQRRLRPGARRLVWRPAARTDPRTYVLRLTVTDRRGRRRVYDNRPGKRPRAPVVRVLGVTAGFPLRSYAPGQRADLRIATDAQALRLQVFHYSSQVGPRERDFKTAGTAMTPAIRVDWSGHRNAPSALRIIRAGEWPSGLYFLRLSTGDGRLGYAPFIVRPRAPTARVAVVLSTNTWQAYNFLDADGDGWGDSWYVSGETRNVDLTRPYLDFGVPFRFRDWDLDFIAWLNRTGKRVDFLSDDDLERAGSGRELASAYDLIVFPGHAEYITERAYDLVERYRDLGGNLMFMAANNFFWKVRRDGQRIAKVGLWRSLGRPEARLVGVQYVGGDYGSRQAAYTVVGAQAAPWAFAGTGLQDGSRFGRYGFEIDGRTAASPPQTRLLATIPDLMGPGRSAEMTYYETPAGAKVFAAGSLNFAASVGEPVVARLVENVWARLSRP
jgi:hypothetical protein